MSNDSNRGGAKEENNEEKDASKMEEKTKGTTKRWCTYATDNIADLKGFPFLILPLIDSIDRSLW